MKLNGVLVDLAYAMQKAGLIFFMFHTAQIFAGVAIGLVLVESDYLLLVHGLCLIGICNDVSGLDVWQGCTNSQCLILINQSARVSTCFHYAASS